MFDCTAKGRSISNLTVVDDATHESVAIVPERALSGNQLVRILENLAGTRGLPKAIRTDNGKELCGRAMLSWAHARSRATAPDLTGQAPPERLHRIMFRHECLNEH